MDAIEFYRLRDDRTDACVGPSPYSTARVAISIDEAAADTLSGQVALVLAVNLAARWSRSIRVRSRHAALHPCLRFVVPGAHSLEDLALKIAQAADPFGLFHVGPPDDDDSWLCLHIGVRPPLSRCLRIGARGWLSLIGEAADERVFGSNDDAGEVAAAALAACIGVGCIFRRAIGDQHLPSSVLLSVWNLRGGSAAINGPATGETNVGRMLLVGAGAVGSALAWLLPLLRLGADVVVVDGDRVEVSNLNRSPLFTFADLGLLKAEPVAAYLRRGGISADPIPLWFDEAVAGKRVFDTRPDVVVPAANERDVRHAVQHAVPPLQVYGTTSADWQAFLGRHIPLVEDCLACRFPATRTEPVLACATGRISMPASAETRDAALPFLSSAAATLAVAELIKLSLGSPRNPNFAVLDFKGPFHDFLVEQRGPRGDCICRSQQGVWHQLNGHSIFANR